MISVAMATYNGEKFIGKQLETILNQTIKVDEIIIVDDCSQDNTVELIRDIMDRNPDTIKLISNTTNIGYKRNFKKALELCSGDYIFLSDQDDEWELYKVEEMLHILKNNDISVLSSSFKLIDDKSEHIPSKNKFGFSNQNFYKRILKKGCLVQVPLHDLFFHNMSQGCSLLITREIRDFFIRYFVDDLPHDWQLNVLGALNNKTYFYYKELFRYRIHSENTIGYGVNKIPLKNKFSFQVRTMVVNDCVKVCEYISKIDREYIFNNKRLCRYNEFSKKHISYLKNSNILGLILQNIDPVYFKVKSFKGRIADLAYVLKNDRK